MKNKAKTGGGKLPIKKPSSARDKQNLRENIGRSPPQPNQKKDIVKKDNKKTKTIEADKSKNIPIKKPNASNTKKEEKVDKENLDKEKELLSSLQKTNKDFIKVFVRFRPLNELENDLLSDNCGWETPKYISDTQIGIYSTKEVKDSNAQIPSNLIFKYDKIFNTESQQSQIYENVGKRIVGDVMEGYNGTIFAYGQSGSGKTYTMYGPDIYDDIYKGIIPRIVEDIFNYVEKADDNVDFQFKLSVLEIYKEVMYDLLSQQSGDIKIQENPETGIVIEGLSEVYLSSIEEFFEYVDLSQSNRKVAETKLNHNSSRSHCILILEVTQSFKKEKLIKKGTLNLVDLAGSEKVSKTGAVGLTLEEAKKINLSLSTLGNVIHALTHKSEHIPYRDSKLTRLLKESLGGNYKTSLIVTCSPHSYNLDEVISSLLFAKRVKTIKNVVKVNIKYSYEELQKMVYLLNAKLKRALNGEKEDENADKDNEDNIICSNCNLLRKEKKLLESKVQSLLDTIHQKDLEIAKLKEMLGLSDKAEVMPMENSKSKSKKKKHKKKDKEKDGKENKDDKNKKGKKGKDKNVKFKADKGKKGEKDNSSDESSDEETSEENDKDNSLFEEKEKKVNTLYNKVKDKLSKIQEENARINIIQNEEEELRKIQLKIDTFNKAIHNYIKDKDKNKCFLKMDDMIKQSILMVKNVDYKKGFDEYKENLNKIFDDNIKNIKSQKDLSNCFNIYFFYEYLRFYFNNQIIIQGYRKLILDNRSLEKMNTYLFDIVHDILSVNFDMANDNVINANALNLLKASLVGDSFVQNPGLLHGPNFERNSLGKKLTFTIGNELHQKIIKIVSRKNLNLLKNSFASPNSQKASLAVNDPKNAQNALNLMNATPEANIALINKVKSQETEKSESKLQMIRNVLIQEIKETDSIKKNMEELKEYINNIINLNINFFNQKILNGKGNLSLVTQKKVIKDSVENLQNNLEDDNTEYIAIETNIAITNNKVENLENKNEEEHKEEIEKISEEKNLENFEQ
jgi:kinesin family protein 5